MSILDELIREYEKKKYYFSPKKNYNEIKTYSKFLEKKIYNQTIIKSISHRNQNSIHSFMQYLEDKQNFKKIMYDFNGEEIDLNTKNGKTKKKKIIENYLESQENSKKNAVLNNHIIFSTKETPTKKNVKKYKEILQRMQKTFLINGNKSVFYIDNNTPYLHAHVLVNLYDAGGGKHSMTKNFFSIVKKEYKNYLNQTFKNTYVILKKDENLNQEFIQQIKDQKTIIKIYGEDGLRYFRNLLYKQKFAKNQKKLWELKKKEKEFKITLNNQDDKFITSQKNNINKFLKYQEKGKIKKKLSNIIIDDKSLSDNIIDYCIAKKDKLIQKYHTSENENLELENLDDFIDSIKKKDVKKIKKHYEKYKLFIKTIDKKNNNSIISNVNFIINNYKIEIFNNYQKIKLEKIINNYYNNKNKKNYLENVLNLYPILNKKLDKLNINQKILEMSKILSNKKNYKIKDLKSKTLQVNKIQKQIKLPKQKL